MLGKDQTNSKHKVIAWISFLIVDLSLYKTTQLEILEHSAERGHEVCLFATYSKDRYTIDNPNIHITLVPLRYIPVIAPLLFAIAATVYLPFYVAARRVRFIIVEPDLTVLAFVWKPFFSLLGIRIVLDIRSTPVDLVNFRRYLSALWFNVSVVIGKNAFDGMTTLTLKMKKELCERFNIASEFVGVWTSGVSTTLFDPAKYSKLDLREKLSLRDKFIVMYHGSLSINRGILESIRAVKILKTRYPNIVFFVLGSGPGESAMKELVQEIGVQNNVIFHDPVLYKETPKFIAMSDVGLIPLPNLPMWRNQCPLKLLEYLAMEKRVIATDIPANREVIGKHKCGIYVSSATPEKIADAILYAYNSRKMAARWGQYGRMIVEKRYSWRTMAEHLDFYLSHLSPCAKIERDNTTNSSIAL